MRVRSFRLSASIVATLSLLGTASVVASPGAIAHGSTDDPVRFATFNASLNRLAEGQLITDLSTTGNAQAATVAQIIQRTRPDVLLINEFDFDAQGTALRLFQDNYLSVSQGGAQPITYRYRFTAPSNTGISSGFDLNNNGQTVTQPGAPGYGDDSLGFGAFPGQFGMAVYSRYPIDTHEVRTFQHFLWKDMPGALLPDDPTTSAPKDWYSPAEQAIFPLSSKSHWDLPIKIDRRTVHFLVSHPTPPVFDGPEDRNGLRNFDEIRFWSDYISPGRGRYIYDDEGKTGGLKPGEHFVIAGDQNSDPLDGDSVPGAIQQLLDDRRVNASMAPSSAGAPEAATRQGGANATHRSDPKFDTADFADTAPGNLRADYVLPDRRLRIVDSAVFWPLRSDPLSALTGEFNVEVPFSFPSSDHRLVWVDVKVSRGR